MKHYRKCADIPDQLVIDIARMWRAGLRGCVVDELVSLGVPEKMACAKVDKLVRRGVMDYGTSLRCAWPVD